MSLVGLEFEIDHVARLARRLRAGLHGDADVGLSEGGGVVGAVAAHGDEPAAELLLADVAQLVLRRRLGEEVVDAGLRGDRGGGEGVVARHHDRADAHGAQRGEALLDARLHDVLEMDDAEEPAPVGHRERRAARRGHPFDRLAELVRRVLDRDLEITHDRIDRAFADGAGADIDAGNTGLGGKGHDLGFGGVEVGFRQSVIALGERHDGAAFRRLVCEARGEGGCGEDFGLDAADRQELGGHAVAEGDRAGLVEQERVDVARRLDRAPRGGDDVEADQPVHAGDADRGQEAADGRRN